MTTACLPCELRGSPECTGAGHIDYRATYRRKAEVTITPDYCVFCTRHRSDAAMACTYAGRHEFGGKQ